MALIPLTSGKFAIVDDHNYEHLSKFSWQSVKFHNSTYARRSIRKDGKTQSFFMHNDIFGKKWIDHKDGNGLNNKEENLRECTHMENMWNRKKYALATSKFKGVQWWKNQSKWAVRIAKNKKRILVGYFDDEIEAALAYNKAAIKLFGEFASLNKVK